MVISDATHGWMDEERITVNVPGSKVLNILACILNIPVMYNYIRFGEVEKVIFSDKVNSMPKINVAIATARREDVVFQNYGDGDGVISCQLGI